MSSLVFRGNAVRGNVVRGNVVRGNVIRGTSLGEMALYNVCTQVHN
jgi:hypothetical protein